MAAEGTPTESLSYILNHGTWDEIVESWEEILRLLLTKESSSIIEITMAIVMVVTGLVACLSLLFFPAPYGRYAEGAARLFGPGVPVRLAWLLQESPAFLVPISLLLFISEGTSILLPDVTAPNKVLLGLFLLHYFHRSFVYSMLINQGKPTPFITFLLALAFCAYNGAMQTVSLVFGSQLPDDYCFTVRFAFGVFLFIFGLAVNVHSDRILRNLRAPGETGYKIPRGGAFELVTAANYFGETLEWIGYAVAAATPAAAAFAAFTVLNLAPRAISHHAWYKKKFENYPKKRKAYIPFIL